MSIILFIKKLILNDIDWAVVTYLEPGYNINFVNKYLSITPIDYLIIILFKIFKINYNDNLYVISKSLWLILLTYISISIFREKKKETVTIITLLLLSDVWIFRQNNFDAFVTICIIPFILLSVKYLKDNDRCSFQAEL